MVVQRKSSPIQMFADFTSATSSRSDQTLNLGYSLRAAVQRCSRFPKRVISATIFLFCQKNPHSELTSKVRTSFDDRHALIENNSGTSGLPAESIIRPE